MTKAIKITKELELDEIKNASGGVDDATANKNVAHLILTAWMLNYKREGKTFEDFINDRNYQFIYDDPAQLAEFQDMWASVTV